VDKKNYKEAEELGRSTLERRRKIFGRGHEFIGRSLALLGRILAEQKNTAEAEPLLQEASTLFQKNCPNKKELLADAENWLGACLVVRKQFDEAEQLLVRSYEILKADPGVPERYKDTARQHVLQLYEAWGKPEKAAAYAKPPKS
jgi:eukaryotic-like serine/threonine-protein kinase